VKSKGREPSWAFERKGYRTRLPADLPEPWYSREYADALAASGLHGIQLRRVLQGLPHSLSAGLLAWRKATPGRPSTHLDRAAERLCQRYGWVDRRTLTEAGLLALLPPGEAGSADALCVLRAVLKTETDQQAARRQITEADLCRFLEVMPRYSPERVALLLMIHTGEDLGAVLTLAPDDPRSYSALWRAPDLIRELPRPRNPRMPYVLQAGGNGLLPATVTKRLAAAAAIVGTPMPRRRTLRDLHDECVAKAIVRVAA